MRGARGEGRAEALGGLVCAVLGWRRFCASWLEKWESWLKLGQVYGDMIVLGADGRVLDRHMFGVGDMV